MKKKITFWARVVQHTLFVLLSFTYCSGTPTPFGATGIAESILITIWNIMLYVSLAVIAHLIVLFADLLEKK